MARWAQGLAVAELLAVVPEVQPVAGVGWLARGDVLWCVQVLACAWQLLAVGFGLVQLGVARPARQEKFQGWVRPTLPML